MQADVEMNSPRGDKVERFPKVVPMEHKLLGDNFYVRDCYAEYYTRVVTLLKGPEDCALEEKKAREEFEREAKAEIKRRKKAEKIEEEKKARAELEEEKEAGDQVDKGQEPPTTPGPGDKDGVTITGTPGIGKSVFMGYFYRRYREEHPDVTIIMSSYNRESVLKRVVITRGAEMVVSLEKNTAAMHEAISVQLAAAKANGGFIELLDGPPDDVPSSFPWVSFTSPNAKWKALIRKDKDFIAKLYMPVWTLDELNDAAIQLGRGDLLEHLDAKYDDERRLVRELFPDQDVSTNTRLESRFSTFGGVARPCFLKGFQGLKDEYSELQSAITGMSVQEIFRALVAEDPAQTIHRLLHYIPTHEEPRQCTVVAASTTVAVQLAERARKLTAESREQLLHTVRGIPEAAVLAGFILETHAYQKLKEGVTMKATKLCGNDVEDELIVTLPPGPEECQITNNHGVSAFDVDKPQLGIPVSKNLESIDGFFWLPRDEDGHSCLLLFQVTVSLNHPVKANGCVEILKSLGMWDDVVKIQAEEKAAKTKAQANAVKKQKKTQKKPTVALVFVIPEVISGKFETQEVLPKRTSGTKGIVKLAAGAPVVNIGGIGRDFSARLNAIEIGTVGELRTAAINPNKRTKKDKALIEETNKKLRKHESDAKTANGEDAQEVGVVQQIPQYKWAI